jgi:hypothetical protein
MRTVRSARSAAKLAWHSCNDILRRACLGRNWAVVLPLAAIAAIFWPPASPSAAGAESTDEVGAAEPHSKVTPGRAHIMPSELGP